VIDKVVVALVDLAEMQTLSERKRVGEIIIETLLKEHPHKHTHLHTQGSSKKASLIKRQLIDELRSLKQRLKWERNMSREDLHVKGAAAMVVKLEGNLKFSSGDLKGAVAKYTEALALCPLKTRKERVVLYSNRAQCHLLLQDPDSAISDTTRALSISNPVNSHSKSLWRRAQAYDIKGLDKESLLDAIMFINESSMPDNNDHKDKKYIKVPYYAAQLVRKKIQATWLFRDAARKHGNMSTCSGACNESESPPSPSPSPSSSSSSSSSEVEVEEQEDDNGEVQEEEDESGWETVSEIREEETISPKHKQPAASGTATANGNGKSNHFQSSSLADKAGGVVNSLNKSLESKTNAPAAITSVNRNASQGQGNSGSMIMVLPTIKEESISEEEILSEQKKKWIETAKHGYITMMKNKRIQRSANRN
ncbi:hypothetical protein KI387_023543, partial [Taxus chinensis]